MSAWRRADGQMYEVVVLVLFVLVVFFAFFLYSYTREGRIAQEQEKRINSAREKLKLAEKRYFQGKIKKDVFDAVLDDIEVELAEAELVLFRMKKSREISVEEKTVALLDKVTKPTKHRRAKIARLLFETELLRSEVSLLEGKLMKRELRQSTFQRLMREKENEMLAKESELVSAMKEMNGAPHG